MSWQLLSHSGSTSDTLLLHCSPTGHAAEWEEKEEREGSEMSEKRCQGGEEKIERGDRKMVGWRGEIEKVERIL